MQKYNKIMEIENVDVAEVCCFCSIKVSLASGFPLKGSATKFSDRDKNPHASSSLYLFVCVCVFVEILLQRSRFSFSLCVEVKGQSNSFLYCNLDQY